MIDFVHEISSTRPGMLSLLLLTVSLAVLARSAYMFLYRGLYFKYKKGLPYIKGTIGNNIFLGSLSFCTLLIALTGFYLVWGFSSYVPFKNTRQTASINIQKINSSTFAFNIKYPSHSETIQLKAKKWKLKGLNVMWNNKLAFTGLTNYNKTYPVGKGESLSSPKEEVFLKFIKLIAKIPSLCTVKYIQSPTVSCRNSSYEVLVSESGYILKRTK